MICLQSNKIKRTVQFILSKELEKMRIICFAIYFSFSISTARENERERSCETNSYPTDKGSVCGAIETTDNSNRYEAFYGKLIHFFAINNKKWIAEIPFSTPPVGERRFLAPEPALAWEETLDASVSHSIMCPQIINGELSGKWGSLTSLKLKIFAILTGQEDCLYLNLYAPIQAGQDPLPVMVWIYGGGFTAGSGAAEVYGPQKFMDTNKVILVSRKLVSYKVWIKV